MNLASHTPAPRLAALGLACVAAAAMAGCFGGSSGGSGNGDEDNGNDEIGNDNGNGPGDDNGVAAGECDTTVNVASGADGLDTDAGVETIQMFALGDDLCAFDPSSGVVATLDSGLNPDNSSDVEIILPGGDPAGGGTVSGAHVDRVIYTAGDEIRSVAVVAESADLPSPERISAEDGADSIDMMFLATDYQDPDNSALAYRRTDDGQASWYAVRVGDDASASPADLDGDLGLFGPITDADTGEARGWLAHRRHDGPGTDAVVKLDPGFNQVGDEMFDSLQGLERGMQTRFDDGTIVFSESHSSQTDFYLYDPAGGDPGAVTYLGHITDTAPAHFTTSGSALFMTGRDVDGNYLWRVDASGVEVIDQAAADTTATMAVAVDDRVVWAWRTTDDSWDSELRSVAANGGTAPFVLDSLSDASDTTFVTTIRASANGWVFYNLTGMDPEARAIPADGSTDAITFQDQQWQGGSNPADTVEGFGAAPPREASEVFLVEVDASPGTIAEQRLRVLDAANPANPPVDLGALDEEAGFPSVMMTEFGLGPHRLMITGSDLVYANSRVSGSAVTLVSDTEPPPGFRLLGGF